MYFSCFSSVPWIGAVFGVFTLVVIARDGTKRLKKMKYFIFKLVLASIFLSLSAGVGARFEKIEKQPAFNVRGNYRWLGPEHAGSFAYTVTMVTMFYSLLAVVECTYLKYVQVSEKQRKISISRLVVTDFWVFTGDCIAVAICSSHTGVDPALEGSDHVDRPVFDPTTNSILSFPVADHQSAIMRLIFSLAFTFLHVANIVLLILTLITLKKNGASREVFKENFFFRLFATWAAILPYLMSINFSLGLYFSTEAYSDIFAPIFTVLSYSYSIFVSLMVLLLFKPYRQSLKGIFRLKREEGTVTPN